MRVSAGVFHQRRWAYIVGIVYLDHAVWVIGAKQRYVTYVSSARLSALTEVRGILSEREGNLDALEVVPVHT